MNILNFSAAFVTIPLFYIIYYRYFAYRPVLSKHLQALLAGVAYAILLKLCAPYIEALIPFKSIALTVFFKAAFLEKLGAFLILIYLFSHFPDFTLLEATLTGMMFALGFSGVENIFYALVYGERLILIRILFSTPLHFTTCGIMGYFLGKAVFGRTLTFRLQQAGISLALSLFLHWLFDLLLMQGGYYAFIISPLLIATVVMLENIMARAYTVIPYHILRAMGLRFEDYVLMNKQKKFERWIRHSMGLPDVQEVGLFLSRIGVGRVMAFVGFLFLGIVGLSFQEEFFGFIGAAFSREEEILLLGIFPSFIGVTIMIVGAINPDFFKVSELKIPVITDVEVSSATGIDETMVTYDFTHENCFLRTSEPLGIGTKLDLRFSFRKHSSRPVKGTVVWENHIDRQEGMGSVIKLEKPDHHFRVFLWQYYFFRFKKGIIFNLKLPGFESTRKYFMRPITAIEEDRVYQSGDLLFHEGDVGDKFYLIKKGRVILFKKKDDGSLLTIDTIDKGQILGEMSITRKNHHTSSAICVGECIIGTADKKNLNALLMNNIEFARSFIDTLVERIAMSERILVEYIQQIEANKKENERFFHSSLMLILLGLGYSPEGMNEDIDAKKMGEIVKTLSPNEMGDLINLVTWRLGRKPDENEKVNAVISKKIQELYSKMEIEVW